MKRYLITGGAGFIGSAIVRELVKTKHKVRVLDNLSRGSVNRLSDIAQEIAFVNADIRDWRKVLSATKDIDAIIHLAFINGTKYFYEKPGLVLSVGVKGMVNILDAAEANGVKELFVASSSEVYQNPPVIPTPEAVPFSIPDPHNPRYSYAGGKIISELLSLHLGNEFLRRVVIFRPHNVYGPDMGYEHVIPQFCEKIASTKHDAGTLSIQGTGNETRAFIYIDDFVRGVTLLLRSGKNNQIYNIGTMDEISIKKLALLLEVISGKNIIVTPTPLQKGSVKRRCPDIKKIMALGFEAKMNLRDGLRITYDWYAEHPTST